MSDNRGAFTFRERCSVEPDHFSLEIDVQNQNPNAVIPAKAPSQSCPVCSSPTAVDMDSLKQCDGCGERWTFMSEDRLTNGLFLCVGCSDAHERGEDVPLDDLYPGDTDG